MFERFYELTDDSELPEEDYDDSWSQYRFAMIREILNKVDGNKLSDKNRMRYYKLSEEIFKALQERMRG